MFKQSKLLTALIILFSVFNIFAADINLPDNHIILKLNNRVRDIYLETFISSYSRYELVEIKVIARQENIRLFSFNDEIITRETIRFH